MSKSKSKNTKPAQPAPASPDQAAPEPVAEAAAEAPPAPSLNELCQPHPHQRMAAGRNARSTAPRSVHALWKLDERKFDPLELLAVSNHSRVQDLAPVRYGRMLASPFTYLRGSPIVMNHDLATTPVTGLRTQICGDAHLMNFGLYASPERELLFDLNDFDETLPGPWEWDVKRLAVSFVVAARSHGFRDRDGKDAAQTSARSYREHLRRFAEMPMLDLWYSRVDATMALQVFRRGERRKVAEQFESAHRRNRLQALTHYTAVVDNQLSIVECPPLVQRVPKDGLEEMLHRLMQDYKHSLADDRRELIDRFRYVDFARKVVGVGSVGTRCYIMLLDSHHTEDPLLLQVKEAEASILEPLVGKSKFDHHGRRVVTGQKLMQSASDIFLGWSSDGEHHYYFRQLRDMKGSADIDQMSPADLTDYANLCGWVLARAHARAGDPAPIAGYLGKGESFDVAIAEFAKDYADQNDRDYEALKAAHAAGRITAVMDL